MKLRYSIAAAVVAFLLFAAIASASPEKTDRFGCHRCLSDCDKYSLLKSEYHCHGDASRQSQNINIAPRIYGNKTYRRVASVIDGDTLTVYYGVGGKKEKIRILGIDAPEASPKEKAECYSAQATAQLKDLTFNKLVLLEKDKLQKDDRDKYKRLLRYVFTFDNISVSEEMLKGGFAKAYPSLTAKVEYYKSLENSAKAAGMGMWSECARQKSENATSRLFPEKGERYGIRGIN